MPSHKSVTTSHTVKIKIWLYGHSRSGRGCFFWPAFFIPSHEQFEWIRSEEFDPQEIPKYDVFWAGSSTKVQGYGIISHVLDITGMWDGKGKTSTPNSQDRKGAIINRGHWLQSTRWAQWGAGLRNMSRWKVGPWIWCHYDGHARVMRRQGRFYISV